MSQNPVCEICQSEPAAFLYYDIEAEGLVEMAVCSECPDEVPDQFEWYADVAYLQPVA